EPLQCFLDPPDTVPAMLRCYSEAFRSHRFCSEGGIMKLIACHHLAC
ncbi:unnamed protein product, partial [Heterosigma akashiwo]